MMETQPLNPHLRMMLGEAFIMVTAQGKARLTCTYQPAAGD